ncbi:hypothetical protein [Gaetbulibacter saemankumensis]|uniref:hypothetical protein n=1 Tax=Gaetbulibacter saemankumensis TaxID=311208 RepID=UPI0004855096|nr:hypothetical protein [Gaetbulibacter saemankumensis]
MIQLKHYLSRIFLLLSLITCTLSAQENEVSEWPKDILAGAYTITIYQPENASYIENKLKSSMAFALKSEAKEPVFGMLWTTSLLDVDRTTRQASLASVIVDEVRLPEEVRDTQKQELQNLIDREVPKWNIQFSLEDLIESLEEVSVYTGELNHDPPKIVFANEPSALITIDGEPKLKSIEKGYSLVENTGAFIVKNEKDNTFYLRGGDFWYEAKSPKGPWQHVKKVPSKINRLAEKAESEGKEDEGEKNIYSGPAPKIVIALEPSELIVFDGEPKYTPIQNSNLLYVENTESNIFMHIGSQTYYVLISGRWFTTQNLKGNWTYLSIEDLPADFKSIPSDSKKSIVLSSVPGTDEAKNAVYDAQIPQTAAVTRDTKATDVAYNGNPEFKNVEGLNLQYAVNTESSVFKDGQTYFLCDNAIWFTSNTPNGPWQVADDRPTDIEKIPADNPRYNTKYVQIYETSPTTVYVGYTPGYNGSYVEGPTIVYGTGYYYNPWYNGFYYHYPYSYGFSIRYNPWYGWSFGFNFGSPFRWFGYSYWHPGWHHWGPPFYRPPFWRPGYYWRPNRPIYWGRPGVHHYTRPVYRPNRPNRPGGNRPSRPDRPNNRPSRPDRPVTTRPSRPSTQPTTRPVQRPTTRPTQRPTTRPTQRPNNRPVTRPITRPTRPTTRPAPRPMNRPTARPTARPMPRSSGMGARRR